MHTLVRHSHRRRHAPGAPFLLPFRRLHHTRDDLPHLVRRKPSLAPPARSVFQPLQPLQFKTPRPSRHGGEAHTQRSGNVRLSGAFGAAKNDASPEAVSLAAGLTVSHALQVKFLFRGQFERGYGTGHKSRITDRDCYCKLFKLQDTSLTVARVPSSGDGNVSPFAGIHFPLYLCGKNLFRWHSDET